MVRGVIERSDSKRLPAVRQSPARRFHALGHWSCVAGAARSTPLVRLRRTMRARCGGGESANACVRTDAQAELPHYLSLVFGKSESLDPCDAQPVEVNRPLAATACPRWTPSAPWSLRRLCRPGPSGYRPMTGRKFPTRQHTRCRHESSARRRVAARLTCARSRRVSKPHPATWRYRRPVFACP